MAETLRQATTTRMVLAAMLAADGEMWGHAIRKVTGLPSGTVYPILKRLRERGWARDRWEPVGAPEGLGRPPRRYRELTEAGSAATRERAS